MALFFAIKILGLNVRENLINSRIRIEQRVYPFARLYFGLGEKVQKSKKNDIFSDF